MGKKSENELKSTAEFMKHYDLPYELLSSTEMTKRYPQLKFTPDWMALYDPEATLIYANRCLNAFQVFCFCYYDIRRCFIACTVLYLKFSVIMQKT